MRILVTGGGTGGHVSPALAVVQTIRAMEDRLDRRPVFRYLGSLHGVERGLAESAGIEFAGVQTGKLRRSKRWWGMISRKNAADIGRIPVGIAQAVGQVRRFKPHVVLATGGYVSVPPVIAAGMAGVPVLIHEQTVQIGLANRIAGRFASKIALTFGGSAAELPPSLRAKSIVTGNPVRAEIFRGDAARCCDWCGFARTDDGMPVVYVTGGAQGAQIVNRAVGDALPEMLKIARVIHQCGRQAEGARQDEDWLREIVAGLPQELRRRYFVTAFVRGEIGDVYAAATVLVGRSGAGTVAEVCALGKPAVFVPLVPTGGDEQTRNAQRVVDAGGAVIVKQSELTGQTLLAAVAGIVGDGRRVRSMGDASRTLATPSAAEDIAKALLELAKRDDRD